MPKQKQPAYTDPTDQSLKTNPQEPSEVEEPGEKNDSKEQEKKQPKQTEEEVLFEVKANWQNSKDARTQVESTWDDKENIFYGKIASQGSLSESKSRVSDPRLSSIAIERSGRVMAQNPAGSAQAMSLDDKGKNALMNLIVEKYIIPNATSQYPLLIKERLMDLYSLVYGVSFGLVDRVFKKNYVGADLFLLPIRMCYPEPGVMSLEESSRFTVAMMKDLNYIESLKDQEDWKHIDELIAKMKDGSTKTKSDLPSENRTVRERDEQPNVETDKNNPECLFVTEYRQDRWITFAPDYDFVLRDIENPHDNDELPIVAKYCFPTMESIWGLGEFERGETLQKAIDSLINLYMDGVKMSIFPPMAVDPKSVVASSMKWGAGERWILTGNGQPPSPINVNPRGLDTFQSTYQFLVGSLLNMAGTTDTSITADYDPGMGRTPQALKMQANRESTRDSWDRFMMEQCLERIFKKFVTITANDTSMHENLTIRLFGREIEAIKKRYPDVEELLNTSQTGRMAEVQVDGKMIEGVEFDYQIVPGSTMKASNVEQNQTLTSMLELVIKNPQINDSLKMEGKQIKLGELFQQWVATSGLQDYDKIVTEFDPMQDKSGSQGIDPTTGQPLMDASGQAPVQGAPMQPQLPPMPQGQMPGAIPMPMQQPQMPQPGQQAPMMQQPQQQPDQGQLLQLIQEFMASQQQQEQGEPAPQAPDLGQLPNIAEQMFGGIPYDPRQG